MEIASHSKATDYSFFNKKRCLNLVLMLRKVGFVFDGEKVMEIAEIALTWKT